MTLWQLGTAFAWQQTPVPMAAIGHDWWGEPWPSGARHALVADPTHLWLLAADARPPLAHPGAGPGDFREGLWQGDVAELFISNPARQSYLEFNLSPSGAWWCAAFRGPRQRIEGSPMPRALTHSGPSPDGGWQAALGLPLAYLREQIGFSEQSPLNVTLILNSPQQRFFSAGDLGGGQPDFHQPARFAVPQWQPMAAG